jgi:serine/threonine protein kinase
MGMDKQIAGYPTQLAPHLELRRVLGEGGSSIVFEAFHTRLKVPVAVKLLSVRGALAGHAGERLLREAELYALLDDPRIPRVFDVDELANGTPYVVMEFVPGGSLELLLARGPLSPRRAVMIAKEVLAALAYVHSRGVLHRDVKPANVILNESDGKCQVRLVDFGIAKVFLDAPSKGGPLTQQGTLVGTPHYMAPERLLGDDSDERADIYSVGVMLYEMLTGSVPFSGPTLGEVIAAVLRDSPTPLHVLYPQIMPELAHLTMRAMDRNPNLRYGSADEMLQALVELEAALSGEVSSPRIVPAARAMSSRPPARPLSFPSLELTSEDLYPLRRRTPSFALPLLLLALGAAGAWAAWTEPGVAFVGYLKAQVQGQESGTSPAPATGASATGGAPTEALTAAAPSAALPEQAPQNLFWDAPRRLNAAEPRSMLLDTSAGGASVPAEAGGASGEEGEVSAESGLNANTAAEAEATPEQRSAAAERELRQHLRVRDEEDESSDRYYEPVRSVPLQPVLDNIENALREAARDVAPPPQAAPLPRRAEPEVPENPY